MEESFKINVKLTENDLKDYAFAISFSKMKEKTSFIILFVISLIFILFYILAIVAILILKPAGLKILFQYPRIIPIIGFSAIGLYPVYNRLIVYAILKSSYKRYKLLGKLKCYEFFNDRVNSFSDNSSNTLNFTDIYRIDEYKQCFVVYRNLHRTEYTYFFIPRRCFKSKDELDKFLNICISNIDNKKLRLKKYGLFISQPDYEKTQISNQEVEDNMQKSSDDTLIEISYSYNINEFRKMYLKFYYKSIVGKIITLIGIGLVSLVVTRVLNQSIISIVVIILGVMFILMPFIYTYNVTNKNFKIDAIIKKTQNYKFKENSFICTFHNGESFVKWDELEKAEEVKSDILLYVTKRTVYVIPKRVFDDRKEELDLLRKIIKEKVKNAKVKVEE
ncbi:MAG: YcxB family protein [Bacillota bacterium]|nr:YcxB family protein [Bacillota bacterium]